MMPLFPSNPRDPTGQDKKERQAMAEYARRILKVRQAYEDQFRKLPRKRIYIEGLAVNRTYLFDISETDLDYITGSLADYTDMIMGDTWLYENFVKPAYLSGTINEYKNLTRQSEAYATKQLNQVIHSQVFRRREAYVASRAFEEMKKLSAQVKADMNLVLTDAIANGFSIKKTADELKKMQGINEFRANRIARTEITTALVRAHLDEAEQATIDYGLRTMQMQFSALSPTTRITHANRHAKLYTVEDVRDWRSVDANSINCKCSFITVLVDREGKPINDLVVDRAIKMRQASKYFDKEHMQTNSDKMETDSYIIDYNIRLREYMEVCHAH